MKAIETVYRGYRFRSRLEARWAVFFQTLGVPWEYEPEGFHLSTGQWYLPDFRIKLVDGVLWAEVKPSDGAAALLEQFMLDLPYKSARGVVLHEIPDPAAIAEGNWSEGDDFYVSVAGDHYDGCLMTDCFHAFCVCANCGAIGIEFEGRSTRINCTCDKSDSSDRLRTYDHPRILKAYAAARAARFEHADREVW
jgi:hypothetical protein